VDPSFSRRYGKCVTKPASIIIHERTGVPVFFSEHNVSDEDETENLTAMALLAFLEHRAMRKTIAQQAPPEAAAAAAQREDDADASIFIPLVRALRERLELFILFSMPSGEPDLSRDVLVDAQDLDESEMEDTPIAGVESKDSQNDERGSSSQRAGGSAASFSTPAERHAPQAEAEFLFDKSALLRALEMGKATRRHQAVASEARRRPPGFIEPRPARPSRCGRGGE
jgi:hypothetical protein